MNIKAIGRTKSGGKERITMSGYNSAEDLPEVFAFIKKTFPQFTPFVVLIPRLANDVKEQK